MPTLPGRLRPWKKALVAAAALILPASAVAAAVSLSEPEPPARVRIAEPADAVPAPSPAAPPDPSPAPAPAATVAPVAVTTVAGGGGPDFRLGCEKWDNSESYFRCTVQSINGFREPVTLSCRGDDSRLANCGFSEDSNSLRVPPNGAAAIVVAEQHASEYGTYTGEIVATGGGLIRTAASP